MFEFKKKLLSGAVMLGSWIQIPSPSIGEIITDLGFSWAAVDMEHTEIGLETLCNVFRSMKGSAMAPLVRVATNGMMEIRKALDAGAVGVIVPLINSAQEARDAVSFAKYPPMGKRGFAFCRANGWGGSFDDYVQHANEDIAVIAMIESRQAVENINSILTVEGIDGVFIGPYDMSGSFGIVGQTRHPIIESNCVEVAAACRRHGKVAGIHIVKPSHDSIQENIDKGFTLIALGIDAWCLRNGLLGYIAEARAILAGGPRR